MKFYVKKDKTDEVLDGNVIPDDCIDYFEISKLHKYFSKVYDILLEYGARDSIFERYSFVDFMVNERISYQYRFCGIFGFGGKAERSNYIEENLVKVEMYKEDKTEYLVGKLNEVNEKLKTLYETFYG